MSGSFQIVGNQLQFLSSTVPAGNPIVNITVTATNATNSPQTYPVTLTITPASTSANFSIKNGQIFNPSGVQVVPKGVNVFDGVQNQAASANGATPLTTLFPGINWVRLNSGPSSGNGTPGAVYPAPSSYLSFVQYCTGYTRNTNGTWTNAGTIASPIMVVIEDHDNNLMQGPFTGAALTTQTNWYAALATYYLGNPYVGFGTQNEMNSSDGTYSQAAIGAMTASHVAIYNAIRATGNQGIIQIMAGVGGSNPSTVGAGSGYNVSAYSTMTNIVWEIHCYYTLGDTDAGKNYSTALGYITGAATAPGDGGGGGTGVVGAQTITSANGVVPVVIGECGSDSGNTNGTDAAALVSALGTITNQFGGVGFTPWNFFLGSGQAWNLTTDGLTTLTGWGSAIAGLIKAPSTGLNVPGAPQALAVGTITNSTVALTWSQPTTGGVASNYTAQYKLASSSSYTTISPAIAATVTVTGTNGSIKDAAGNVWAINTGAQVTFNTNILAFTSNVTVLAYVNGQMWQSNTAGYWYLFVVSGSTVTDSGTQYTVSPVVAPTITVTGLAASSVYNFRVYASNASGAGAFSSVVNATTTGGSTTISPPSQAVAAGYVNQVMLTDFLSASEVNNGTSGTVAAPWYVNGTGLNYTIANSVLTLNNSISAFNADIGTSFTAGAALSAPGATAQPNVNGRTFTYGYFEAKLLFNPSNVSGQGWPAWWSQSYQSNVLNQNTLNTTEIDFMEAFTGGSGWNSVSCGFLNWFGSNSGLLGSYFGALGAPGLQGPPSAATIAASGIDPNNWNIFGCLITPTYVEMYWNSYANRQAGIADTLVMHFSTVNPTGGEVNNNGTVVQQVVDGVQNGSRNLLLGGASSSPFQVDYVAVWQ